MKIDLKMPVLKSRVILLLGEYDDIKSKIPYGVDCFGGDYMGRTTYQRTSGKLPFTAIIHSKSFAMSVIAHEAVHASSMILDGMGVIADFDNDEIQAYIVQYICENVEIALGMYT